MASMTLLLLLFGGILGVCGYEDGPPVDRDENLCRDMVPTGHGTRNVTGSSPYRVIASSSTYSPGQSLTVTVEAIDQTTEIEGVFVQARRREQGQDMDQAIGKFSNAPAKTQLLKCGTDGSAWGHSEELHAAAATVTWTAPPCDEGPLAFMATIVKGPKEVYWNGVLSSELTFNGTEAATCNAASSPAGVSAFAVMMGVMTAGYIAVLKN